MKLIFNVLGILLIVFGVGTLAWQGFTYTKKEEVAQFGNVQITANTEKTVHFPPAAGGLALVAGIVLVLVGRKNSS